MAAPSRISATAIVSTSGRTRSIATGHGWNVLRELGIPVRGGVPKGRGVAMLGEERFRFPGTLWSLLTTNLVGPRAKAQVALLLMRIRRIDPKPYASMTVREWIDANASDKRVRLLLEALFRLATYSDRPDLQSASAALAQLRLAIRGVVYVDEGWQKIVDSLHSAAVASGVNFVTSSRVVNVDHDGGAVRGVELGGLEIEDPQRHDVAGHAGHVGSRQRNAHPGRNSAARRRSIHRSRARS